MGARKRPWGAVLLVGAGALAVQAAGVVRLDPVDEGAKDASFAAFRTKLIDTAKKHDTAGLLGALSARVKIDFGSGGGIPAFRRHWKLDRAKSPLWDELLRVLQLGGSFTGSGRGKVFWAPYVYSEFPEGYDAFTDWCITGKGIEAHQEPGKNSRVVATLSYNIVKVPDAGKAASGKGAWVKIVTPSGKQAYVPRDQIRSSVDYRASFQKIEGRWKMTAFVAGD